MQEAHQLWRIAINFNDIIGEFDRMAGGEADTINAVDRCYQTQQVGKGADRAVVVFTTPGVHVLPQQVHFTHALGCQLGDFKQNIIRRTADFLTAGVGNHAVSTIFIATFHDGHKRAWTFSTRFRQAVELFDLRETDINHRATGRASTHFVDHFRQAMQRLRPKNNIDVMRTLANMIAFLRRNTATDPNDELGIFLF